MNLTIAIDPGLSGGIAYQLDGQPAQAVPMPSTEGDLVELIRSLTANAESAVAVVEEVGGYIGVAQPGSSAFKFGRNFGFILGVLQALNVRLELVRPQRWQKSFALGTASGCATKSEWKNKLKSCAQRLYPNLKPTLATADALLILDYACRTAPTAVPNPTGTVQITNAVTGITSRFYKALAQ
jgi:crossover junction endodeoxyribonuclease RuvC